MPSPPPSKRRHRRRDHHLLKAWVRSPRTIGAVIPSSRALAKAMARQVDLSVPGAVIELGAGTGVMTHAMLESGLPPDRLMVIERDPALHESLVEHFPDLKIVQADAAHLSGVLASHGVTQISAIVSSLPLLSMPRPVREAIENSLLALLAQGGMLVQFTYGPKSPVSAAGLKRHGFVGQRVKTVLTNIPPAHVWVYRRAQLQG